VIRDISVRYDMTISISLQLAFDGALNLKVSIVSLLPVASLMINSYIMIKLSYVTLVRVVVWTYFAFSACICVATF